MAGNRKRKNTTKLQEPGKSIDTLDFSRPGMPSKDSVTGVEEFKKGKKTYRVIHTTEIDEYENQKAGRSKRK